LKKKICIASNEDGFGPSAFAYYLVRAIVKEWRAKKRESSFDLTVTVFNNSAYEFNRSIYSDLHDVVYPFRLNRDSLIKLEKSNGEVAVTETLRKLLAYDAVREDYLTEISSHLYDADVAIDIGVPLFIASAARLGIQNRITLFDHSWAKTLRLISAKEWRGLYKYNHKPTDQDYKVADLIASQIEEDEKQTREVYIFEPYITPQPFRDHWKRLIEPTKLHTLQGVLGGTNSKEDARARLNRIFRDLGQKPVSEDQSLVLISPGGTPIWVDLLSKMINKFTSETKTRPYIPVLSNFTANSKEATDGLKAQMLQSDKIRWFEYIKGFTQQIIMSAFDLIVTRAGGGTVNDALASNTPFVCVEEPQVQVILIERECLQRGMIPDLPETRLVNFQEDPVRCIDTFFSAQKIRSTVGTNAEGLPAHYILELLAHR
jgi:hypothetical protein